MNEEEGAGGAGAGENAQLTLQQQMDQVPEEPAMVLEDLEDEDGDGGSAGLQSDGGSA